MKTLADLGARMMTADDIRQLFPDEWWLDVFDQMNAVPPVHFVEGSLAIDDLEAGDGPWALIVHGDLYASGDLDFSTSDYKCSVLVVLGSVRTRNLQFTNGASCVVAHDLVASGIVVGRYGDESARLVVGGMLTARALLLDHVTGVYADSIDAIVYSAPGWNLPQDVPNDRDVFEDAVLDDEQLDFSKVWHVATRGEAVLREAEEAFLRRARPRKRDAKWAWREISDSPGPAD